MRKAYRELFDEVHASQRLRTEVLHMKDEQAIKRCRVPRAALIAAVLAIALAGTAVAAELWGKVHISLTDPNEENTAGAGYTGEAAYRMIPAESLSEEALERSAQMDEISETWKFSSWAEAEEFLGLELADNPRLEALLPNNSCSAWVINYGYLEDKRTPFLMLLSASYQAEGCRITQCAHLRFQYPGYPPRDTGWGMGNHRGETYLEEYVTANGIEASIVTTTGDRRVGFGTAHRNYTSYTAYFIMNDVFFYLRTEVSDPIDHPDSINALAVLKEILDAYE